MDKLDVYNAMRFKVLFEKWFPNQTEVELSSIYCVRCGLAIYQPRPEPADLNAKYRYLAELGQDYSKVAPYNSPTEIERSTLIYEYLSKRIRLRDVEDVLDYGGGDGRLMQAFVKAGKTCFNLDYSSSCIPSVRKLGDTLDDVGQDQKFDLIVCSHVIEHVAEPLSVIRRLAEHLKSGCWLYVEVPMEIWKAAPLQHEPVTHINFFTPSSLWNLLYLAGLIECESRLTAYLHSSGTRPHGIRGLGRQPKEHIAPVFENLRQPEVEQFIRPAISTCLRYICSNPRVLLYAVRRSLPFKPLLRKAFRKVARKRPA
jgi:SAM-dependent methyltransferase